MSGWVCRGVFVLMMLALPGCVDLASPAASGNRQTAPVKVLGGAVTAMPPAGYCVDTRASQAQPDSAVVLMGKCSGASQAAPALITLSIGGDGSSSVLRQGAKAMSNYFSSPAGRAALARDGRAASVKVSRVSIADGALLMRVEDRRAGAYWRAIRGLRGRLVMISVSAPEGGTLSEAGGRAILDATMAAMLRANPAQTAGG